MTRLILHMGLHKTGTTAIQQQLSDCYDQLLEQGIWYPEIRDTNGTAIPSHHELFHALAGKSSRLTTEDAETCIRSWQFPPNNSVHTLIVSSESLSRHVITAGSRNWSASRSAFLEKLADIFSAFEVRPVIVIRRWDDYIRSFYQEHVRKGTAAGSRSFRAFREQRQNSSLRILENIELTEKHLGWPTVLIYEDLAAGNNLVAHFLKSLDIKPPGTISGGNERIRLSLTPKETLVKLHLNQTTMPFETNTEAIDWLQSRAGQRCLTRIARTTDIWESPNARESFLAQFNDEAESIRKRYFPERSCLFPTLDRVKGTHYRDELSPEEKQAVDQALRRLPRLQLIKRFRRRLMQFLKRRLR